MHEWPELDKLQELVESTLREVDGGSVAAMQAGGEAAEVQSTQQAISAWGASRNVIMGTIGLHKLEKGTPEYQKAVEELQANKDVVSSAASSGASFVRTEMGQAANDAQQAGGQFFTYLKTKFQMLMNWLPAAIKTVFNAVSAALRAAFNFVKGFFTAKDGKWAYLKGTNILGFPASSWLIWGAVAAFVIIALSKVVKWLKNRRKTENASADTLVLFDENMMLTESEMLTEDMQGYVYGGAATASSELDRETQGAENGSIFWKVMRKIAILLLIIFGISAVVKFMGGGVAAVTGPSAQQIAGMDKLDVARTGNMMRHAAIQSDYVANNNPVASFGGRM